MKAVSTTFQNLSKSHSRKVETQAIINSTVYPSSKIISFLIEDALTSTDEYTIGEVLPSKLTLKLNTSDIIPPNATIEPQVRFLDTDANSEWLSLGYFKIDRRTKGTVLEFEALDRLIETNQPFNSSLDYPNTMVNVFNEILSLLGFTTDSSISINPLYEVPYKDEDITIHDMLSFIASAHGANIKMVGLNKIGFKKWQGYSTSEAITKKDYMDFKETNEVKTYTRIECIYNSSGEYLESGTGSDDETISFYNPYITEEIMTSLLTMYNGFAYQPYNISWRCRPYLEVGDSLAITNNEGTIVNSLVISKTENYVGGISGILSASSSSEQESEYQYEGSLTRSVRKAIKADEPYYGVTMGRTNGIQVKRSDNLSEMTLNSDTWEVLVEGQPVLYIDYLAKKLIFNGELSTQTLDAAIGIITQSFSAQKGYIAELTVDSLDTSTKIRNYLNNDTTDVNYFKIFNDETGTFDVPRFQMVTASVAVGQPDVQAQDRKGNLLYWEDETYQLTTTTDTGIPTMIYAYNELIKGQMAFVYNTEQEQYVPEIVLGAGTGVGDVGKGFIYKGLTGLTLEYEFEAGSRSSINVSEFVDAKHRRASSIAINRTNGTVTIVPEGLASSEIINFVEGSNSITYTFADGFQSVVTIS